MKNINPIFLSHINGRHKEKIDTGKPISKTGEVISIPLETLGKNNLKNERKILKFFYLQNVSNTANFIYTKD